MNERNDKKMIKKIIGNIIKLFNFNYYSKFVGVNSKDYKSIRFIGKNIEFGSEPYFITIGEHVTISSNVKFITHDGGTWVFRRDKKLKQYFKYGKIIIKDNVFIGLNSIILPNIEIGNNTIIGAGSVVTKSVPDNSVVAGNPAKYICSIEEYTEKIVKECPNYNLENYKKNKKEEVLKIYSNYKLKNKIRDDKNE